MCYLLFICNIGCVLSTFQVVHFKENDEQLLAEVKYYITNPVNSIHQLQQALIHPLAFLSYLMNI